MCIPAVEGGNLDKLAKAGGFRKNNDNYVRKGQGFQLTVLAFGSNPDTCHVDIIAPVDPEAPAKPLVVALHNWATFGHGYSLYRNDKNTQTGQEITTRSWELNENGKAKALVITTYRKADGTPAQGSRETSTMLYSESRAAARQLPAGAPMSTSVLRMHLTDVLGLFGVLMMLGAYAATQLGRLDPVKPPSLLLNLIGSSLVMVSLLTAFNLSAFLMEAAWAAVALFGLLRSLLKR